MFHSTVRAFVWHHVIWEGKLRYRLLDLLRCPGCRARFRLELPIEHPAPPLDLRVGANDNKEVASGALVCTGCGSSAPIRGGIPRLVELRGAGRVLVDEQTRSSFSFEWALHRPEDGTWGMTIEERTKGYFLNGVGLRPDEVAGLRVLDAGCGNGSSTLGIARLGALCVGIELSTGLEKAREYFTESDRGLEALYVQANLLDAPFEPETFDVVFSAGVLHHTPDTRKAFKALAPLVKPGGRFYVWLYRHEKGVTPIVNTLRAVTTRLPPPVAFAVALVAAPAFQAFTRVLNATGVRGYRPMSWRSSALALLDIFGARYAHAHTCEEVTEWYLAEGFEAPRLSSLERRGFSVCGTKGAGAGLGQG